MHFATLTTLLIPLLLASVLATPTPVQRDSANGGTKARRQTDPLGDQTGSSCGPDIDEDACCVIWGMTPEECLYETAK